MTDKFKTQNVTLLYFSYSYKSYYIILNHINYHINMYKIGVMCSKFECIYVYLYACCRYENYLSVFFSINGVYS